jgi:enoyl-CoA hydratase
MSEPLVRYDRDGAIATLTLNRADKRNALNLALWGELNAHLDAIVAAGDALAVVVLQAAGPVFCAGNDLKERGAKAPGRFYQAKTVTRLAELPQPVIVAVQGGCYTGGLELALAGDITCPRLGHEPATAAPRRPVESARDELHGPAGERR